MENNPSQYRSERDDKEGFAKKVTAGKIGGHAISQPVIGRRRKQTRMYPRRRPNGGPSVSRGAGANRGQENVILERMASLGLGTGRAAQGPARVVSNNAYALETDGQRILRRMAVEQREERDRRRAEGLARRRYGGGEVLDTDDNDNTSSDDDVMDDIITKLNDFRISERQEPSRRQQIPNVFGTINQMASPESSEKSVGCGDVLGEDSFDLDMDKLVKMFKAIHLRG